MMRRIERREQAQDGGGEHQHGNAGELPAVGGEDADDPAQGGTLDRLTLRCGGGLIFCHYRITSTTDATDDTGKGLRG